MNIKPIGQKVVAEILPFETRTASGLIIPDTATEKQQQAVIKSISQELQNDENNILKEGDKILFNTFSGERIKFDEKEMLIIELNNILAVI